ncbi:conserved hypothetical protein [Gluconacetobacter diazotrophicus PA1 5]|nr:hypothetical protein [Gluconacetobacter diazotrophicus]ACI51826.1 conserved hypothetical protein [Gluconacetobacter diazotrophicus PA1 5]MBB2155619.1 hypothetical protein [Gluconacetobacter diazotrophicus]TWB11170.1 hypothetical protein FBZ86_101197 [Gluconacetobacter diazotrophicus]
MRPTPDPEPRATPDEAGPGKARPLWYGLAAGVIVIAGFSARMAHEQAQPAPAPAISADGAAGAAGSAHVLNSTQQFAMISPDNAPRALQQSGLTPDQQARILAGIRKREYRLVRMPIYDQGGTGGVVTLSSGGITQTVPLTAQPRTVLLPIRISGEVDIVPVSDPGVAGLAPGAITVLGPTPLPIIHRDEMLVLDVIVQ